MTAAPIPEAVAAAMSAPEERRAELTQAQAARRTAEREVAEARIADSAAIARARDEGRRDPARRAEKEAADAATKASLEVEVAAARVESAEARVDEALDASLPSRGEELVEQMRAADEQTLAVIAQLRACLERRNGLMVTREWLGRIAEPSARPAALASVPSAGVGVIEPLIGANGSPESAETVLGALVGHVQGTAVGALVAAEEEQRRAPRASGRGPARA